MRRLLPRTSRNRIAPFLQDDPLESVTDAETRELAARCIEHFRLGGEPLWVTTDRGAFQDRLGRPVRKGIGGAYIYHPVQKTHLVLINLESIDRRLPKSVEIVVAEEFMHMRDWLDGDRRRHSKHGYDRIAHRVADLTGASLEEVRCCILPSQRRQYRHIYQCPGCLRQVPRRRHGTWSCASCWPVFDRRFVLRPVAELRHEVNRQTNVDDEPAAIPAREKAPQT